MRKLQKKKKVILQGWGEKRKNTEKYENESRKDRIVKVRTKRLKKNRKEKIGEEIKKKIEKGNKKDQMKGKESKVIRLGREEGKRGKERGGNNGKVECWRGKKTQEQSKERDTRKG